MSDNQSDRLESALAEVMGLLKQHDLGGFIILHDHDDAVFKMEFPSWSTARFRPKGKDGQVLHLKMEQEKHQDVEGTVTMLLNIRDICLRVASQLDTVRKRMESAGMEIDHNPIILERNKVSPIFPQNGPDSPPGPGAA